ncbi:hypothetical protein F2Q68_00035025 [Brassica cretica]|uniref:Zinc knuckle CX2CX4HX4C domain-containing protein n=1 Tax=Brassica cretica TaxID=69181 RepID=A0A8S9H7P1_BRACR|nr:hypothetical protein F2Q68_00035025 [Brassica cretica]
MVNNTMPRKPLVRVPESDITELIERNKFTLIGHIDVKDADKARIRVLVNDLKPLIMKMDLQLPSGDVVEIEMEYENLHKHCFYCKSLSHEDDNCQTRAEVQHQEEDRRNLGISQQNTLESIEEGKRRQDDRKRARNYPPSLQGGARWTNYKRGDREDEYEWYSHRQSHHHQHRSPPLRRGVSEKSLDSGFEENRRRYNDNYLSARRSPPHNRGPTIREHCDGTSSTFKTLEKEYHPSAHSRGNCASPIREISSRSNQSPATAPNSKEKRTSTSSRLSDPRAGNVSGEDRVSAKESLSVNTQRTNRAGVEPLRNEPESPEIPQDLAPQNMELAPPPRFSDPITRPSNSNIFETGRLEPNERSPIRTLSEDRIHVSLRLGPLLSDTTDETEESGELPVHPALSSKAAGKREVRKQKGHSPLQGVSMKRRCLTLGYNIHVES